MLETSPRRSRYEAAAERLREICASRGHLRVPDEERQRKETRQTYKHGYELRFRVRDRSELVELQTLLLVVGIDAGLPYEHGGGYALPIYGAARILRAIMDLGLLPKRPRRRASPGGPSAPRRRSPVALGFHRAFRPATYGVGGDELSDPGQLKVALRLFHKGPLTASKLSTTAGLLGRLRRRGLVAALPARGGRPRIWTLTPKGIRETRRRVGYYHRLGLYRAGNRPRPTPPARG